MSSNANGRSKKEHATLKRALLAARLQEFDSLYPDKKAYFKEIQRFAGSDLQHSCKTCGCTELEDIESGRAGICKLCREQTWYTAGTFFHRIRKPKAWLFTIWLIGMSETFNACDLERLLGIAHSTASIIIKKVLTVIKDEMKEDRRAIELSSADFLEVINRRSRKTPVDAHPQAEEEELPTDFSSNTNSGKGQPTYTPSQESQPRLSLESPSGITDSTELSEAEKEILSLLSKNPTHIDELCRLTNKLPQALSPTLMILELNGIIEGITADTYVLASPIKKQNSPASSNSGQDSSLPETSVLGFIEYIRSEFGGISRKYLELYLAFYWCYCDRSRWTTGSIIKACNRFPEFSYEQILAFVSPPKVSFIPILR
jgi:hypothetical protein